jgi:hypothetical protein
MVKYKCDLKSNKLGFPQIITVLTSTQLLEEFKSNFNVRHVK